GGRSTSARGSIWRRLRPAHRASLRSWPARTCAQWRVSRVDAGRRFCAESLNGPRSAEGSVVNIASRGARMAVDWEQRVDFDRLRRHRMEPAKAVIDASDLGALLLLDPNNLRYLTSTAIGTWERNKNIRFALLPRGEDP